jgi:hypothetical protein
MRLLPTMMVLLGLAGCAAPQPRCDDHLVPINAPGGLRSQADPPARPLGMRSAPSSAGSQVSQERGRE